MPATPTTIPTPDGIRLHLLPDGRTLVEDTHAPRRHRWRVLRPGWQAAIERWRPDLVATRGYTGTYYLTWWAALAEGQCCLDLPREEMDRLVALVGQSDN